MNQTESLGLDTSPYSRLPLVENEWTETQKIILALAWKICGMLSLVGSIYVIHDIIGNPERRKMKLPHIYNRIMIGMSVSDLLTTISAFILSTWPIPRDTLHDDIVWGNVGNTLTCDIQGAVIQFGALCGIFYYLFLTIYFNLFVRYSWTEMKLRIYEPFMHGVAILFPAFTAGWSVHLKLMNPTPSFCWINSYPINCETSEEVECIRGGQDINFYRRIFMMIPAAIGLIGVTVLMITLYCAVRRQEERMRTYEFAPSSRSITDMNNHNDHFHAARRSSQKSNAVFRRASFFIGVFFTCWTPIIVGSAIGKEPWLSSIGAYMIWIWQSIVTPLFGVLNAMVYTNSTPISFIYLVITRIFFNETSPSRVSDLTTVVAVDLNNRSNLREDRSIDIENRFPERSHKEVAVTFETFLCEQEMAEDEEQFDIIDYLKCVK